MIGALNVNEVGRDRLGREVFTQRWRGSGPVRPGDSWCVMVRIPASVDSRGRIYVQPSVAGEVRCVTPPRGSRRGSWELIVRDQAGPGVVVEAKRDAAAVTLADRWADQ